MVCLIFFIDGKVKTFYEPELLEKKEKGDDTNRC